MKTKFKLLILLLSMTFASCEKFLDRRPITSLNDENAWTSETVVRLYATKFYNSFFSAYGELWDNGSAPLMGYQFSDDTFVVGRQNQFTLTVPSSSSWSYTNVRATNIMIDRVENRMQGLLSDEAKNHWLSVGKFFRAYAYYQLVLAYADVPFYTDVPGDSDFDALYKPRTPRNEIMDVLYDDLQFAMANARDRDNSDKNLMNKYIIAAFTSRIALYEGSWQKHYYNNSERAKKFFDLAMQAAEIVMSNSTDYGISGDYRSLFTSKAADLRNNKESILMRVYDRAIGVTHSIATYSNMEQSMSAGPTTDLIKSYICKDGKPWRISGVTDANKFDLASMIQSRDSRFEATFHRKPLITNRASFNYIVKFFPRDGEQMKEEGIQIPLEYISTNNETSYPVMRFSEVLLNWIEAKAEAESLGGSTVNQGDLDRTINRIRNRDIHPIAAAKGVTKTSPMDINNLPIDPDKDNTVSALIWEIRRERRMEFAFEHSRIIDLRRWKKLEYMDTEENPDLLSGGWVNFPTELPAQLISGNKDIHGVVNLAGNKTVYTGANNAAMVGFYYNADVTVGRLPFLEQFNVNPYLTPIGTNVIDDYAANGYVLQQTEGWGGN